MWESTTTKEQTNNGEKKENGGGKGVSSSKNLRAKRVLGGGKRMALEPWMQVITAPEGGT